jgi:secretion/DNA translocation related TadE-like protein
VRAGRDDAGFVTVAVAGLLLVLLSVTSLVAVLGAVGVARHRAAAAADLAALAAAERALEGPSAACTAAATVARRQSARLTSCSLDGLEAWVEVTVRPPGRVGLMGEARARSHAGPRP